VTSYWIPIRNSSSPVSVAVYGLAVISPAEPVSEGRIARINRGNPALGLWRAVKKRQGVARDSAPLEWAPSRFVAVP
jgi:hypothetical protein